MKTVTGASQMSHRYYTCVTFATPYSTITHVTFVTFVTFVTPIRNQIKSEHP